MSLSKSELFKVDDEASYLYEEIDGGVRVNGYIGVYEYVEIPEYINGNINHFPVILGCLKLSWHPYSRQGW